MSYEKDMCRIITEIGLYYAMGTINAVADNLDFIAKMHNIPLSKVERYKLPDDWIKAVKSHSEKR